MPLARNPLYAVALAVGCRVMRSAVHSPHARHTTSPRRLSRPNQKSVGVCQGVEVGTGGERGWARAGALEGGRSKGKGRAGRGASLGGGGTCGGGDNPGGPVAGVGPRERRSRQWCVQWMRPAAGRGVHLLEIGHQAAASESRARSSQPRGPYTQSSVLSGVNLRSHWWGGARKRSGRLPVARHAIRTVEARARKKRHRASMMHWPGVKMCYVIPM
jgi:hypothetical protein